MNPAQRRDLHETHPVAHPQAAAAATRPQGRTASPKSARSAATRPARPTDKFPPARRRWPRCRPAHACAALPTGVWPTPAAIRQGRENTSRIPQSTPGIPPRHAVPPRAPRSCRYGAPRRLGPALLHPRTAPGCPPVAVRAALRARASPPARESSAATSACAQPRIEIHQHRRVCRMADLRIPRTPSRHRVEPALPRGAPQTRFPPQNEMNKERSLAGSMKIRAPIGAPTVREGLVFPPWRTQRSYHRRIARAATRPASVSPSPQYTGRAGR